MEFTKERMELMKKHSWGKRGQSNKPSKWEPYRKQLERSINNGASIKDLAMDIKVTPDHMHYILKSLDLYTAGQIYCAWMKAQRKTKVLLINQ